MLSGMVDTLMLSAVGNYAVGAVGTANSYIGIFIIMFSIISSGMVSVMTQNIGAGRPGVAYQARQLGLLFNAVAGVLMAVFLFSGAGAILRMVGIADALYEPALIYLKIVGLQAGIIHHQHMRTAVLGGNIILGHEGDPQVLGLGRLENLLVAALGVQLQQEMKARMLLADLHPARQREFC